MKKLIAIGGGEIGRDGFQIETRKIDQEIIKLTGKKSPKILFIPTASNDSKGYIKNFEDYFGNELGCITNVLLLNKNTSDTEIKEKIFGTDIIYVGGGNTFRMLRVWKKLGVGEILKQAWEKGIVIAGLSAGAICWFSYGHSDSRRFKSKNVSWDFIKVTGLGWFPFIFCPHYHFEKREENFQKLIKRDGGIGIAMDNKTAIEIVDDKFRILRSEEKAKAYRITRNKKDIKIEELISEDFKPLKSLF